MRQRPLGMLEYALLTRIRTWDGAPSAADLSRSLEQQFSPGSVATTLGRLMGKGLLAAYRSDPRKMRGGRGRVLYIPTAEGERLWGRTAEFHRMLLSMGEAG